MIKVKELFIFTLDELRWVIVSLQLKGFIALDMLFSGKTFSADSLKTPIKI